MNIRSTFAAAAVLLLAVPVSAFAQSVCTAATISGEYAGHGQGWLGLAEPFSPEAVVATRFIDGKGKFTGAGHQSIAGISRFFTITGTYTVDPNCAVTFVGTTTPTTTAGTVDHWFGVIADAGNKIYVTRTDKGSTTSTEFDRVVPLY